MIVETIFLGILLGFIYYEIVGLTPGGVIVPGYIALYYNEPLILLSTLLVVILTYIIIKFLGHKIIIYGRRAFLAAVIIGFLLKWILETYIFQMNEITMDLEIIGYIIPGLIANEMRKQGIFETLVSLVIVSSVVYFLIQTYQYFLE